MLLLKDLLCLSFFPYATSFPLHLFLLRIYYLQTAAILPLHFVFPFQQQLPVLTGSFLAPNSVLPFLHHYTLVKNRLTSLL